jgi:prevent-host-death family protein
VAITASEARATLFPLIEKVNADMAPVLITSKNGNAVLISESEYESMLEMQYLLSTPADRGETRSLVLPVTATSELHNEKAKKKSRR